MSKYVLLLCIAVISWSAGPLAARGQAAGAAAGSAQALPADAPSRDQVMTLLDLMQVRKAMIAAMQSAKQVFKDAMEQSFRSKNPNPTTKQLEALHAIADAAMDDLPMDEMLNAAVTIYQRHLSKTDLEELIRFYSSPVGQKMIHEQPQILQESMQAGAEIQKRRFDEIMLKVDKRVQELAGADANQTAAPRK